MGRRKFLILYTAQDQLTAGIMPLHVTCVERGSIISAKQEFTELIMHPIKCACVLFGEQNCLHATLADTLYLGHVVTDVKYRLGHSDVSYRFNITACSLHYRICICCTIRPHIACF